MWERELASGPILSRAPCISVAQGLCSLDFAGLWPPGWRALLRRCGLGGPRLASPRKSPWSRPPHHCTPPCPTPAPQSSRLGLAYRVMDPKCQPPSHLRGRGGAPTRGQRWTSTQWMSRAPHPKVRPGWGKQGSASLLLPSPSANLGNSYS